jgi:hypothetical protein
METREKILVAAMVIALGYGGYDLVGKKYIERSKAAPTAAQGEFNTAVSMAKKVLMPSPKTALENHVVMLAGAKFQGDPFSSYPEEEKVSELIPKIAKLYTYTGYVHLGDNFLAIINGSEYKVGDMLDGRPITEIDSTKVVLKSEEGPVTIPIKGHLE